MYASSTVHNITNVTIETDSRSATKNCHEYHTIKVKARDADGNTFEFTIFSDDKLTIESV